jgi:hypothetical protein
MPVVQANGIDVHYEVQGEGEPIVLIPYLAADQACYAFQVADYAKHFTCFTVDLRGAGLSGKPEGTYSSGSGVVVALAGGLVGSSRVGLLKPFGGQADRANVDGGSGRRAAHRQAHPPYGAKGLAGAAHRRTPEHDARQPADPRLCITTSAAC